VMMKKSESSEFHPNFISASNSIFQNFFAQNLKFFLPNLPN